MVGSFIADGLKYRNALEQLDPSTFPQFVQRVLKLRYPNIVVFGPNKDGGIDLVADEADGERIVFQCKFLSGRTVKLGKTWQSERKRLGDNLVLDNDLNLVGESQYLPWRDASKPICRYVLCHNHVSRHLRERDETAEINARLAGEIERFFHTVIASRCGFEHLGSLTAEVLSGDDLLGLCEGDDRLVFQLFGLQLPRGIEEIASDDYLSESTNFDQYLSDRLPYYSRARFKASSNNASFLEEADLLARIFGTPPDEPVFIITGPGGYGKTR